LRITGIKNCRKILIDAETSALQKFQEAHAETSNFDLIVLIGHGNKEGIQFASGNFMEYSVLASWIQIFKPVTIILITCMGGHSFPTKTMFSLIPTLENVYGSPVVVYKNGMSIVNIIVPALMLGGTLDKRVMLAIQGFNFIKNDAILLHHERFEFASNVSPKSILDQISPHIIELKKRILG
jgi:hypothetical protein